MFHAVKVISRLLPSLAPPNRRSSRRKIRRSVQIREFDMRDYLSIGPLLFFPFRSKFGVPNRAASARPIKIGETDMVRTQILRCDAPVNRALLCRLFRARWKS
jgi:hypothetical protein